MFYEELFSELNKQRVKYVITGGIAVNLHGIPRVTGDIDLLIDLDKKNVIRFSNAMKILNYKAPVSIEDFCIKKNREDWIKHKEMKVFSLWNKEVPYRIVDVFVENPIDFKMLYKSRLNISVGKLIIPVVSIEHLIKLKTIAGRKQDMADIVSLRRVKRLRGK